MSAKDNDSRTFEDFTRLLAMRTTRFAQFLDLNAPNEILEKELELIQKAVDGCKAKLGERK